MKHYIYLIMVSSMAVLFLSGCLYPNNELAKNQMPNESQLEMVEKSVLQYREENNGLVPIKTKDADVDQYEKYLIDFNTLKEHQLLTEIPGTAYENGGIYQYTIIDPEDDLKVKLIDLRLSELLRDINTKINIYRSKNMFPPFGEQIDDGIFKLNYKKLGYKDEPVAVSPYSKDNLPIIMNEAGEVYIDYRIDLQRALEEFDDSYQDGEDIRSILVNHYPFVPAYSLPYTVIDGDVEFLHKYDE